MTAQSVIEHGGQLKSAAPESLALFSPPAAVDGSARARLLLVDDDKRVCESLKALLSRPGREIEMSHTGAAALARLMSVPYDIVLLDIRLPDMLGLDVLSALRASRINATVIIVSGDDGIESAISALKHGAHEYVRKPFEPANLRSVVDNALSRVRLERENLRMRTRLERSEHLHRFLVDQSPDLIYTLDPAGNFTFVNDRFLQLLGYDKNELLGKNFATVVHPDDAVIADHAFNERRCGMRATNNIEIRLRAKPESRSNESVRTVVLSAMGIYLRADGPADQFLGTYGVCRDITDRKRAEEIINHHAFHDQITGLPNRLLFRDRLSQAIAHSRRKGTQFAVMLIDLDRFKLVNDTSGHAQGDALLQQVAGRLRRGLRGTDTLSRLGGDEFTILVSDLRGAEDAVAKAQHMLSDLRQPFYLEGKEVLISASIGIAIYPGHGADEEELVRNADLAMYQVKRRDKDGVRLFAPEMSDDFSERTRLEGELRGALQRPEFELRYQPIHNVARGVVEVVEALARWKHPELGLLDPSRFIHIAEESGLAYLLGDRVLELGCAQLKAWRSQGFTNLRIAINISARDFEREDFISRVTAILAKHEIPPQCLELEITESVLIEYVDAAVETVRRLRSKGIRVSIDDFGTRYSSLGYLRRFPVNTIKIDQSFTRELDGPSPHSPIVSAIVGIARGFGLDLIAEGVERDSHRDVLSGMGCDSMQGYLFSKPIEAAEISTYLRRHTGCQPAMA